MIRRMTILSLVGVLGVALMGCGRYGPPLRSNTGGDHRPYWAQTPPPPEPVEEEEAAAAPAEPDYVRGAEFDEPGADEPEATVEP